MSRTLSVKARQAGFPASEQGILSFIVSIYNDEANRTGKLGVDDEVAARLGISKSYLQKAFKIAIEKKVEASYALRNDWVNRRQQYRSGSAASERRRKSN